MTMGLGALKSRDYYRGNDAARQIGLSSNALSRITGTVFVQLEQPASKRNLKKKKHWKTRRDAKKNSGISEEPTKSTSEETSDSGSSEEFEMNGKARNENIGLSLKFNKRNLEVRGYTRKIDGQWMYSKKTINLLKQYTDAFPEVKSFFDNGPGSKGSRDSYNASEIFPTNPNENIKLLLNWLDDSGVKDLARVSMNSNILDDDDVHDVWTHVMEKKSGNYTLPKKTTVLSLKPNSLYKPGLNRGCVSAFGRETRFVLLDRVICIDPCAPLPLGQRGTIVGIQDPPEQAQQEEEAFRSTSSTVLKTFVILSDPIQDVFDSTTGTKTQTTPEEARNTKTDISSSRESLRDETANLMSSALQSLLRISQNDESTQSSTLASSSNDIIPPKRGKPTLVMLYPFQVLNLSQNAQKLADAAVMLEHEEQRRKNALRQQPQPQALSAAGPSYQHPQHKSNSIQELFPKRRECLELQKPSSNLNKNLSQPEIGSGIKTFAPTRILQRNVLQETVVPAASANTYAPLTDENDRDPNYDPVELDKRLRERYEFRFSEEFADFYPTGFPGESVPDHKLSNEERVIRKKNRRVMNQHFKAVVTGKRLDYGALVRNCNPDLVPDDEPEVPLLPSLKAYLDYFVEKDKTENKFNVQVNGEAGHSSQTHKTVLPKLENASANRISGQGQAQHQTSAGPSASGIQTQVFYRSPEKNRPQPQPQQQPPPQQKKQPISSAQQNTRSQTQQLQDLLFQYHQKPQQASVIQPRPQEQPTQPSQIQIQPRPQQQPKQPSQIRIQPRPNQPQPPPLMALPTPIIPIAARPRAPQQQQQHGQYHHQTQGLLQMLGVPNSSAVSQIQSEPSLAANPRQSNIQFQPSAAVPVAASTYSHPTSGPAGPVPTASSANGQIQPVVRSKGRGQRRPNNAFVPLQVDRAASARQQAAQGGPDVPGIISAAPSAPDAGSSDNGDTAPGRSASSSTYPGLSVLLTGMAKSAETSSPKNETKPRKSRIAANFGPPPPPPQI